MLQHGWIITVEFAQFVAQPELIYILLSNKDMGTVVLGKLESGSISKGQQIIMMPNRVSLQCTQ